MAGGAVEAGEPEWDAYFDHDYSTQDYRLPWTTLFSYSAPGWVELMSGPAAQTADGRVKVVANPAGRGNVARFEIRDSDPVWPGSPYQKSELRTVAEKTFNRAGGAVVEDVRWFWNRIHPTAGLASAASVACREHPPELHLLLG
jgi:hypothetical protein